LLVGLRRDAKHREMNEARDPICSLFESLERLPSNRNCVHQETIVTILIHSEQGSARHINSHQSQVQMATQYGGVRLSVTNTLATRNRAMHKLGDKSRKKPAIYCRKQ
jgi:hypothetical protein